MRARCCLQTISVIEILSRPFGFARPEKSVRRPLNFSQGGSWYSKNANSDIIFIQCVIVERVRYKWRGYREPYI